MLTMPNARQQRGLSLVEMMVGIAVGLFIVAAAAMLVSAQLGDNRRLLLETAVQQDLRAAADIIVRDLRRAGALPRPQDVVLNPATGTVTRNTLQEVTPLTGEANTVTFDYSRAGAVGPYGFRLNSDAVQTRLAGGTWQDLTDRNVLKVTEFLVTADNASVERLPCPRTCPSPPPVGEPANYCWPTLGVRAFTIRISGQAASDANVARTVESRVRLRNDELMLNDVDATGSPIACAN